MKTDLFCRCGAQMTIPEHIDSALYIEFFRERHTGEGHGETTLINCALARDGFHSGTVDFMDYQSAHFASPQAQEPKK